MKKYTYENLETGQVVDSDKPLDDPNLKLLKQIKSGQMVAGEVKTK